MEALESSLERLHGPVVMQSAPQKARKRTRWTVVVDGVVPGTSSESVQSGTVSESSKSTDGPEPEQTRAQGLLSVATLRSCRTAVDEAVAGALVGENHASEVIVQHVLELKNASVLAERKAAQRALTYAITNRGDAGGVFRTLFAFWRAGEWDATATLALMRALPRFADAAGEHVRLYVSELLHLTMLGRLPELDPNRTSNFEDKSVERQARREHEAPTSYIDLDRAMNPDAPENTSLLRSLLRLVGVAPIIQAIRPWFESPEYLIRLCAAHVIAFLASSAGFATIQPLLEAMLSSRRYGSLPRETAALSLRLLATRWSGDLHPHLPSFVQFVLRLVSDPDPLVKLAGARAVAALATVVSAQDSASLEALRAPIWDGVRAYYDRTLVAFLSAAAALIRCMPLEERAFHAAALLAPTMRAMRTHCAVGVLEQLLVHGSIPEDTLASNVLGEFLEMCFLRPERSVCRAAARSAVRRRLARVAALMSERVGVSAVLTDDVVCCLDAADADPVIVLLLLETVRQVLRSGRGQLDLKPASERRLIQGLLQCLRRSAPTPYRHVSSILWMLGAHVVPWSETLVHLLVARLQSAAAATRAEAARLVCRLVPMWVQLGDADALARLGIVLAECYNEVYPEALAAMLEALGAILDHLTAYLPPSEVPFAEILSRLVPVLRNPAEEVQAAAALVVMVLARHAGSSIPDSEWLRVAQELRRALGAQRRQVRYRAVDAYGAVARVLGEIDSLGQTLLAALRQTDRSMRVAASVALAIATLQSPDRMLAQLLDAYIGEQDKNVQTGILKSVGFYCAFSGDANRSWNALQVYAVTRLLESALIERYDTHRQLACEATGHFALALVGHGYEEAMLHLLNHVWPAYVAQVSSPEDTHLEHAVAFSVQALGIALGAGVLNAYLTQGLFHPAQAVRKLYWTVQRWQMEYFGGWSGVSSCLFGLKGPEWPAATL